MLKPVLKSLGVSKDAKLITLQDATGTYNVSTNTGGYGAPNAVVPSIVGMRWRYWADDLPFADVVISDPTIVTALTGAGTPFGYTTLGLPDGAFPSGVYQVKYYPFETSTCVVTLQKGSRLITVTAGTAPNTFAPEYVAVLITDGTGVIKSDVLMIDRTKAMNSSEFYVDGTWQGNDVGGYKLLLATEADLKVLVTQLAESCIAGKIGALSAARYCRDEELDRLTEFTMWKFSADVKFQCKDYSGAHNLIVAAEKECRGCETDCGCKTCST